jgi:hypothetical protein
MPLLPAMSYQMCSLACTSCMVRTACFMSTRSGVMCSSRDVSASQPCEKLPGNGDSRHAKSSGVSSDHHDTSAQVALLRYLC